MILHYQTYYHAIDENHREYDRSIRTGLLFSATCVNLVSGNDLYQSDYSEYTTESIKESVFEKVRRERFGSLSSRKNAIFLFESLGSAEKYNDLWWNGERKIFAVNPFIPISYSSYKISMLNCNKDDFEEAAERYFNSSHPPYDDNDDYEVVYHGVLKILREVQS